MENLATWERLPTLDGERVRLRWLDQADVPRLLAIFSHPEVMRYWSCVPYTSPGQAQELLAEIHAAFARRSLFQWGVVRRADDLLMGTCTLAHVDLANERAELGFALHRDHWGQGYVREAAATLVDFAFARLGFRRLEADVDPRNQRSIALLEKLGFVREGFLRERWHVGGEVQDAYFYGLLAREWRKV